jgi:hypothetical protein
MMSYEEQRRAVEAAAAEFPAEFGLKAWPGERFKIGIGDSYVKDSDWKSNNPTPVVMLYTHIKKADGSWAGFAKGTAADLRREVRA